MIEYRPFLNSDPPLISEIWRAHPPMRALAQAMSPALLERLVLSKPYFDRFGLLMALEGGRPIGFVHGGFGPRPDLATLDRRLGVVCLVMVLPHPQRDQIARKLLDRCEHYLREHGAKEIYGGSHTPLNPFYLGLYGGSELSGVLDADESMQIWLEASGYRPLRRRTVLQQPLAGFRPPVNRQQMKLRRRFNIDAEADPRATSWWEACTLAHSDRSRFTLVTRDSGQPWGHVVFWDMEPLASNWGVHAAGLVDLRMRPSEDRAENAIFLVAESLRQLQSQGVTLVETHVDADDDESLELFTRLGFRQVEQATIYRKQADPGS